MTSLLLPAAVSCLFGALCLWLWSLARRDASVVDVWWGIGFVGVAWFYRSAGPTATIWQTLHLALVSLWGLRLALHIAWRSRGEGEDRRYAAMRIRHGADFWWRSLFTVFILQAGLVVLLSYPLLAVQTVDVLRHPILLGIGLALAAIGLLLESLADWQLTRFLANSQHRGQVLDRGLWRYSRHPNYFGESVLWWGFGLCGLAVGSGWSLLSPLVITTLLLRISGVTLLEKTITSRRPGYRDYQERTSAFVPWPPKPASETLSATGENA